MVSYMLVITSNLTINPVLDPSPRDDIISLAYSLIYMLTYSLPWMWKLRRLRDADCSKPVQLQSIASMKKKGADLFRGSVRDEFIHLLNHGTELQFGDTPDYARFVDIFQQLAVIKERPCMRYILLVLDLSRSIRITMHALYSLLPSLHFVL